MKGSFHIFVVTMIQQWAPQHPLCFISCVFVWCAIPLKIITSESELWRKHYNFFHILQNNGNLYAKIKYPTIHGKKVKCSYFSLCMRLFTKKLTGNPMLNKISHLYRMIFCFLGSDTCYTSHKRWYWFADIWYSTWKTMLEWPK